MMADLTEFQAHIEIGRCYATARKHEAEAKAAREQGDRYLRELKERLKALELERLQEVA